MKPKSYFSGGKSSFDYHINFYNRIKANYLVRSNGASREIHMNGTVLRFNTTKYSDNRVGSCCREVIREATKFTKEKGALPFEKRTTLYRNTGLATNIIMKDVRDISAIDIKGCYWNIAHKAGIISDKVFKKFEEEKGLRLMAIGNLNKRVRQFNYVDGKKALDSMVVVENINGWVWDYVVYRTYDIFDTVNNYINNRVISFKTDCFYVCDEDVEKVIKILGVIGYEHTHERYEIIGQEGGYVVVANKETGELKYADLGMSEGMRHCLDKVDKQKLKEVEKDEPVE